ncbi:putative ribonuclease H-like domain-containing protein [Tanacetum coccineum]
MNQFCEIKGIKREFSVARTPQQNRVAERKNRTLIEVARTMLVDSKLPTTFWAEAVNTACLTLTCWLFDVDSLVNIYKQCAVVAGNQPMEIQEPKITCCRIPVSNARPTFDTAVPSPLVNTARPSVNTANAFEEHPNLKGYLPYNNAFSYPPFPKYIFNGIT